MNIVYEIYEGIDRGGPGSSETTAKAFSIMGELPPNPLILDIGCGHGIQTMELARLSDGYVIGLIITFRF